MGEYLSKVKHYVRFSQREMNDIFLSLLVITFVFAFDDGRETLNISFWGLNFLGILILVAISFLTHQLVQKLVSVFAGYRSEYKVWGWGVIIALLFSFVMKGAWFVIPVGGVFVYHLAIHRIGQFRYGLSGYYSMLIAVSGPLANIVLALIFKLLFLLTDATFLLTAMKINLWMAFWFILPVPPLNGGTAFFGGRSTYTFFFGFIIAAIIMISLLQNIFLIVLGTLVISLLFWLVYYLIIERFVM
ncbi:MAG: hypothetical protein ABIH34_08160 [Nanoarchaeota archaeon]